MASEHDRKPDPAGDHPTDVNGALLDHVAHGDGGAVPTLKSVDGPDGLGAVSGDAEQCDESTLRAAEGLAEDAVILAPAATPPMRVPGGHVGAAGGGGRPR